MFSTRTEWKTTLLTVYLFISNRPPLQRGSSFTFLTPGTPWDFSLVSHNDKINIIILRYHSCVALSWLFLCICHEIFLLCCLSRRENAKRRRMTQSVSPVSTSRWALWQLRSRLLHQRLVLSLEHVLATNFNPPAWLRLCLQKACAFCEVSVIPLTLRLHNFLSVEIIWTTRNMINMSLSSIKNNYNFSHNFMSTCWSKIWITTSLSPE